MIDFVKYWVVENELYIYFDTFFEASTLDYYSSFKNDAVINFLLSSYLTISIDAETQKSIVHAA